MFLIFFIIVLQVTDHQIAKPYGDAIVVCFESQKPDNNLF